MQHNPFSTRFIQPGAIPYKCFDGSHVNELVQRFLNLPSKRGIIIGPHGSGKSTLIVSFVSELSSVDAASSVHQLRFSTDRSAWRSLLASTKQWTQSSIVILDGYEQLRFWWRAWQAARRPVPAVTPTRPKSRIPLPMRICIRRCALPIPPHA